MGQTRDVGRGVGAIAIIVGINVVFGFVGYFIAFLFAYGFSDQIVPAQHVFFLILIGILVAIGAAVSALVIKSAMRLAWSGAAGLSVSVGLAINLLVLGLGSIISAQHKDDGSVSADFSTTTDVIIAASLLGAALVSVYFVWRALPRRTPDETV